MRVVVFSLAAVSILTGISAYADQMAVPALPGAGNAVIAPAPSADAAPVPVEVGPVQLLEVPTAPATPPATPAAVTPEPSGAVFMATGLLGMGGLMWRRRSLTR